MYYTKPVTSEDEPFLLHLYSTTRADEIALWGWDEATERAFLAMQWRAMQQSYINRYPELDQRIIYTDQGQAGRCLTSVSATHMTVVDLSLLPEYRNKGIGTDLITQLQHESDRLAVPLRLSVLRTNPARRLYERLGFLSVGESELYAFLEWTPTKFRKGDHNE